MIIFLSQVLGVEFQHQMLVFFQSFQIHIYIYNLCTYTHTYIPLHIYTYAYRHTFTYIHVYTHTQIALPAVTNTDNSMFPKTLFINFTFLSLPI